MGRYLPSRPGWYHNPDDPRSLRYWDGASWTSRARPRPPWSTRVEPFELSDDVLDRSVEGPVHPHELREPVASGAWSREWLSWRPRQAGPVWHRGVGQHSSRLARPPRPQPPAKLGPARRPLLALVCLMVIAVGVVISSVAFISPYETNSLLQASDQLAAARFVAEADVQCAAVLPKYRAALTLGADGAAIATAAREVDLLGRQLSRLASATAPPNMRGALLSWLGTVQQFTAEQDRYAAVVGPTAHPLSPAAQQAAAQIRGRASQWAADADAASTNLQLTACRLEPATT